MQAGRVEQLDTPEGIYQNPASRFIAEFVTQANFVMAERRETVWDTEIGAIRCCASGPDAGSGTNLGTTSGTTLKTTSETDLRLEKGELMICQEDVQIELDAAGPLEVQGRQFLGREYQYALLMPSARVLQVRTGAHQRLAIGDRVTVKVNDGRVKFFADA
jgi:iron(III) transport system ATP-binding protein